MAKQSEISRIVFLNNNSTPPDDKKLLKIQKKSLIFGLYLKDIMKLSHHAMEFWKLKVSIAALMFLMATSAHAQKVALKTNLLYDATATANFGIETALSKRWTFDLSGNFNAWSTSEKATRPKWKQWMVQPEFRYWLCDRFQGHFFGIHALGGQFNFGHLDNNIHWPGTDIYELTTKRHQGWMAGAGLAYGYAWLLGRHLSLELEAGAGWIHARYDEFCTMDKCGKELKSDVDHDYFGPTKLAVNIVYSF